MNNTIIKNEFGDYEMLVGDLRFYIFADTIKSINDCDIYTAETICINKVLNADEERKPGLISTNTEMFFDDFSVNAKTKKIYIIYLRKTKGQYNCCSYQLISNE